MNLKRKRGVLSLLLALAAGAAFFLLPVSRSSASLASFRIRRHRRRPAARSGPLAANPHRVSPRRARLAARGRTGSVVLEPPRLHQALRRSRQPLPALHRRAGRKARHAHGDRAAARGRERLQSQGVLAIEGVRASGNSFPRRARTTASPRTGGRTTGATSWRPPTRRSITCRSCTTTSTAGSWRSPPTTAARAAWRARSRGTRTAACPPTTRACTKLPPETRSYVPKLFAVKNIVLSPATYGIELESRTRPALLHQVQAPPKIDVKVAAKLADMSEEEFTALNPALQQGGGSAKAGTLILPLDTARCSGPISRLRQAARQLDHVPAGAANRWMRSRGATAPRWRRSRPPTAT